MRESRLAPCWPWGKSEKPGQKTDTTALAQAPNVAQMVVDADGTLHFGPRTVPPPTLASPEAKQAYANQMLEQARASAARGGVASARAADPASIPESASTVERISRGKQAALKIYPVEEESQKIAGVNVMVYSPKSIPAANRDKVLMEFEIDAEAIAVAGLSGIRVIKVNYRGGGPSIPGNEDIVAVYRVLLKTHRPKSIGMFGASGGCTLAQTTILWLPKQKLPLPGAVGLNTCSGGSNPGDSRYTNNGLDATLSTAFTGQLPFGRRNQTARGPDDPPTCGTSFGGTLLCPNRARRWPRSQDSLIAIWSKPSLAGRDCCQGLSAHMQDASVGLKP